jgi:UDP-N-acetylglucosamine acyltransferase
VAGEPLRPSGLNSIGMKRRGFEDGTISQLKKAYRILFRSNLNMSQAISRIREELPDLPELNRLLEFIESSDRGIVG